MKNMRFFFIFVFLYLVAFGSLLEFIISIILLQLFMVFLNEDDYTKKVIFLFGTLISYIFASISMTVDRVADVNTYYEIINTYLNSDKSLLDFNGEYFFIIIIKLLGLMHFSSSEVYFTLIFLANFFLFLFLYKVNFKYSLWIFILLAFYSMLHVTPFLLQQTLSYSLLLISLTAKRKHVSVLFWIFSVFIHMSALLWLPLYILKKIELKLLSVVTLIFISALLYLVSDIEYIRAINIYLSQYPSLEFLNGKLNFYQKDVKASSNSGLAILLSFFIYVLAIYHSYSKPIENKIIIAFFISQFFMFSFLNVPVLYNRLGFLAFYFGPIFFFTAFQGKEKLEYFLIAIPFFITLYLSLSRAYLNEIGDYWVLLNSGDLLLNRFINVLGF